MTLYSFVAFTIYAICYLLFTICSFWSESFHAFLKLLGMLAFVSTSLNQHNSTVWPREVKTDWTEFLTGSWNKGGERLLQVKGLWEFKKFANFRIPWCSIYQQCVSQEVIAKIMRTGKGLFRVRRLQYLWAGYCFGKRSCAFGRRYVP